MEDARTEFAVLTERLREQYPQVYPAAQGWHPVAEPLAEQVVGDVRPALLVLLGAVGFVLLIGCANVANLLLARATVREREIALRTALGGSRGRLVRQLLTESLLLAGLGGGLGLLLAAWGTGALGRLVALYLPRAGEIELSLPVLGFTAFLILLTGLLFGLIPALQASRADLQGVLKDAGRGSAGAPRTGLRAALVVAEVAVALMLLAGAGLMLRSFQRLDGGRVRIQSRSAAHAPGMASGAERPLQGPLSDPRAAPELLRAGVGRGAGRAWRARRGAHLPAAPARPERRASYDRRPARRARRSAGDRGGPAGESELLRDDGNPAPLRRRPAGVGRLALRARIVVNRTMAEKYWPGVDPIGRRIRFGTDGPWVTVSGIVGDVRQIELAKPAREELYLSYRTSSSQEMSMVVRTGEDDPERLGAAVTAAIRAVDPEQPVFGVMSMERLIENASAERRISMVLLLLFAGIALLLSAIGIYGVMAYTTTQRRHEIGIRLALGAAGGDVLRLVVGQGMRLVLVGLAAGLLGAWALSRVLASQLFGISAQDPSTFAAVALLLGLVALAATWLPARRATRVDPMISLRTE